MASHDNCVSNDVAGRLPATTGWQPVLPGKCAEYTRNATRDICGRRSHNLSVTPIAERYAQMRDVTRVRESALFVSRRIPSELELQARWFAGDFGKHCVSTAEDEIHIIQFGTWNREAGPDFRDAAIRINGSEPVRGCIEIDPISRKS
jgi:hypothetical protein